MYESTQDAMWVHSIDLAREPDFDLGSLRVRPASCEVQWNGVSHNLQRRVMQVLVALAQARGSVVSQDDLVIRCWRGLSVSDDAIYRCISILRKVAADYPDAPFAIEAIPGVGYRLTASGPAEDARAVQPPTPRNRRLPMRAFAAAALVGVLVLLGAFLWLRGGGGSTAARSAPVAVQAFDTLSNSEEARALARRIPNEIVNEFGDSQIETVLASASTRPGLKPGLIVTGVLREEAANVIADVRIEDGATRAGIWSMEFKRDRREASDLPLEVAARVADMVNMAMFARTAKPPLTGSEGLSALLQTSDMIRDSNGGSWAPMLENAQGLVARHPEFAFGHSVLAYAYGEAAISITVPDQARAMREAARREANLTLKLDPQDAGAYAVLWIIEPTYNYAARERILLRGIKVARHPKEPLAALYSFEGSTLSSVGRLREALSYQLIARANDEWGPPKTAKLIHNYANLGNLDAARSWLDKAVRRWPNHSAVGAVRLYIAGFCEQPAEGLAMLDAIDTGSPADRDRTAIWRTFIGAKVAQSPGVISAAIKTVREAGNDETITRETEVMMLAGLGQTREAIAAANVALDHQELDPRFLFTPVMRDVRRDPAFVGLAARMGLLKYWRETGKRPDFCTGRNAASECSPQLMAAFAAAK